MRTTLKRGVGRGASVNGNGRIVLPPGVLTPVTRYRQPARRRRLLHVVGRVLLWGLAGVLMLAGGVAGGAYLFFHESVAEVRARTPAIRIAQKHLAVPLPGQPAVALVVGYDYRTGGGETRNESRSDTIMLLRADPRTKSISMLSFPRDLVVPIVCPHGTYTDKINAAYSDCGPRGVLATVKSLTGVPINYLITVNFRGFTQIVDRLGGVWVDVDRRYFNNNRGLAPGFTYARINLMPGYQRLGGQDALAYVRYRHADSDLYRLARQQAFVRAVKEQISSSFSAFSLPKIVRAVTRNVEVGQGGGEPISEKTILSYALFAYYLPSGHIFQSKIGGLVGWTDLTTDPSNIEAAVQEFLNPDVEAPEKATAVALRRKRRTKAPPPRQITLTVLNGNGIPGSASNAGYLLGQRGYVVVFPPSGAPANAPRSDYFRTKVYFDADQPRSRPAARQVANLFGGADVEPVPPRIERVANNAMIAVVVGQTFHGRLAPSPVDRTPERRAAEVTRSFSALPLLRSARRKVPFRLQLPTVIERTSSLDPEMPMRVYRVAGHKNVRLVFRTGASEYWGIQQTDWRDAPILERPSSRVVLRGREYYLYYSGPHLHMVVLHDRGATYWVVNTILDTLSNETMLAIAKGLRPLRK